MTDNHWQLVCIYDGCSNLGSCDYHMWSSQSSSNKWSQLGKPDSFNINLLNNHGKKVAKLSILLSNRNSGHNCGCKLRLPVLIYLLELHKPERAKFHLVACGQMFIRCTVDTHYSVCPLFYSKNCLKIELGIAVWLRLSRYVCFSKKLHCEHNPQSTCIFWRLKISVNGNIN